ncbi:aspartate racemase [Tardiphaga sp. OK246]|uniref:aspartate/glutamate racemase family protein n=1 Tax=Tardiphaga sp. OK246 TaxID=1855307 RepID=UPI000B688946|nr:amino acid racemase [Tardiphaga sp. OK246]SNT32528.1 aspartate racemase [Tardiphaga sp. OK246]
MKTLGLIGGMSWESTALYYSGLNRGVSARLGGLHSAKMVLANVDFQEIVEFQQSGHWDEAGIFLADIATKLVAAGAEGIALAVNTMHKVAPAVAAAVKVPFLDIRDAIAKDLRSKNIVVSGLLGTGYVMQEDFYRSHLEDAAGGGVLVPEKQVAADLNQIIYDELSKGVVNDKARSRVLDMIGDLHRQGAGAVILGCTELPMLALDSSSPIPLLDSTALHIEMCLNFMLGDDAKSSDRTYY